MTDSLEWLWPLADAPVPVVGIHHTSAWPIGVFDRLIGLNLLMECALADRVLCPECQDHFEEVFDCEGSGRANYTYIVCREHRRVWVPRDARRQWTVQFTSLASTFAEVMKLTGKVVELAPARVWRLGRITWQGESRDVVLARGLNWCDAVSVRTAITRCRKPVVFVPLARPAVEFWTGRVPSVIPLVQVASDSRNGIDIDPAAIFSSIQDAETRQADRETPSVTDEQLTRLIRNHLKTELTDEVYLAAYCHQGTVRNAATFLSEQTKTTVSKDKIYRALKRAGGSKAVLNAQDSNSTVRAVASRPRDKRGKQLIQTQSEVEE